MMLSDSFGLPQGAPNRDAAVAWLTVCGSKEGQDAFNPLKGSIPARTDADRGLYDVYLQSAMDDFASNAIAPSLAHGAAASEGWVTAFNDVMTLFVSDLDVAAAQDGMVQAAEDAGVTPSESVGGEVEIFSWWTAGGEAEGLNARSSVSRTPMWRSSTPPWLVVRDRTPRRCLPPVCKLAIRPIRSRCTPVMS
jgi:hypothetical protein